MTQPSDTPPKRIAILAHGLRVTGGLMIGKSVINSLSRVAPQHEYLITYPAGLGYEPLCEQLPKCEGVPFQPGGVVRRLQFDRSVVRPAVARFRPDVVYALSGQAMSNPPAPQASFPQDSHLFYPERHFARETFKKRFIKRIQRRQMSHRLANTDLIFVQTPVVAERIRGTFGFHGEARVVYGAPSDVVRNGELPAMPPPYTAHADQLRLVYMAAAYAHKNVEGIFETFDQYYDELKGVTAFITVAPHQHPNAKRLIERLARSRARERVINLGQIPAEQVGAYYAHADALLMPTLLETFGLPYVEAMTFGKPALTSDLDFAHAVCGPAALFFDPWKPREMANAIIRFRDDLQLRGELSRLATRRRAEIVRPWDVITREMVDALVALADRGGSGRS